MVGNEFEPVEMIINKDNYFYGKTLKDFPNIKEAILRDCKQDISVKDAIRYFKQGYKAIIITKEGKMNSWVDIDSMNKLMFLKKLKLSDSALKTKNINYLTLPYDVDFSAVQKMLNDEPFAVLLKRDNEKNIENAWVVTKEDLLFKFLEESD